MNCAIGRIHSYNDPTGTDSGRMSLNTDGMRSCIGRMNSDNDRMNADDCRMHTDNDIMSFDRERKESDTDRKEPCSDRNNRYTGTMECDKSIKSIDNDTMSIDTDWMRFDIIIMIIDDNRKRCDTLRKHIGEENIQSAAKLMRSNLYVTMNFLNTFRHEIQFCHDVREQEFLRGFRKSALPALRSKLSPFGMIFSD